MRMVDLIERKKLGEALTDAQLRYLIEGFTDGSIPDYQMSAFAMAVFFRGMTDHETAVLTDAMMRSGDTVDLSRFGDKSVDKHSAGSVGDKTTLIVAPIVACLGGKVAKMSGRGLGHTGGTVDKLDAIPGFRTVLTPEEFLHQVEDIGVAVIGQSGNLTPADKKLYALRDVTATVDSLPLIASSIMSKKLAAGSHSIVLDVKIGSGAFMKTPEDGAKLAERMVAIGRHCGRRVRAVMTDMDIPLGKNIGNALEVAEAADVLAGHGPDDLREVSFVLASGMLELCNGWPAEEARSRVEAAVSSGAALRKMEQWVAAQGGDARALTDHRLLPQARHRLRVTAEHSGYITATDAQRIGEASCVLGAGRQRKDDAIDYAAGITLHRKPGDRVKTGEELAVLYTNDEKTLEPAKQLLDALTWGEEPPTPQPLILGTVE